MLDRFPRNKDVLPNGLRVVTVELPHLHTCSLVLYARVGARYETRGDNGLSHFLEHMLFRGTERFPDAYRINHAIEGLGGTLYAETGSDYSLYHLSLPPESLAGGIDLLGEIFARPTFNGIDVERRIVLEEILEDLDEDRREVNLDDIARALAFPDHPLGYKITGPYENVERFTIADVRRHFAACYGARNMVLAVTGAIQRADVLSVAERVFGGLPAGVELPLLPPPPVEAQRAPRFTYVEDQGLQTSVQLLFRAVPETAPEFPALELLARVLDDGMSTRLYRRVCDELGLAYSIGGDIDGGVDWAIYGITASCAHANVPVLLSECFGLLARLRDEPPTPDEIEKARRRYRWGLRAAFDDPEAMSGWWGCAELFLDPPGFDEKVARMEAVTPAQLREVARAIFRPERLTVAAVGVLANGLERAVRRTVDSFR